MSRLTVPFWALLLPALAAGCGQTLSQSQLVSLRTPAVEVDSAAQGEVHAVRADVTRRVRESYATGMTDQDQEVRTLKELAVAPDGRVAAQTKHAVNTRSEWGKVFLLGPIQERTHSCSLCFYRPGYQAVEVPADRETAAVRWQEAPTLETQAEAVDRLVGKVGRLAPGSAGAAHRRVLLYAASEYERLAAAAPEGEAQRGSLGDKARQLRELAAR